MIGSRSFAVGLLTVMLGVPSLYGQTVAHYRDFQLGSAVASVKALTGSSSSEVQTVHARPAILQDLEWRRPYTIEAATPRATDPVRQIAFSFYNDQLFRLVVDYDRDRTAGMTDADMVEAISMMYGPTMKPGVKAGRVNVTPIDEESGTRVAAWGDAEYAAVLYRSSYASGFRMIVTSIRLTALARSAEQQAVRLDEREAPQRERAREQKDADAARLLQEKARVVNKAAFTP